MTYHIPADRGNQRSRARRQAARRWALGRSRSRRLPALLGWRLCSLSPALLLACFCSSPLHAKIIKGPYLQRVTADGITVMWESHQPTAGIVLYGKTTDYGGSVEEEEAHRIHGVHIRGLEIETRYHYKVLSGRDSSPARTFQTAVRPDSPFRFVYYGDNKNGPHMHRRNALQIAAEKPNIVLQCGDLVNTGNIYSQWERLFFTPAKPLIDHVPLYPSLGNHERNADHYFKYFSLPSTESWYSFDYGNSHFVVLDSNRESEEQLAWLVEDLEASKATWKFVSFHHPPFTAGGNYYSEHRIHLKNLLHPIFEKYGVDVVFNGHDHNYERTRPILSRQGKAPVTYIVNGNGGTPLRYVGKREWTVVAKRVFGYTRVDVNGKRLEVQGKTIDGDVIDAFVIDKGDPAAYEKYVESALLFESIPDRAETVRLLGDAEDLWENAEEENRPELYPGALEMLEKAYALDPTCAECVVGMGIVNRALGHKDLAIRQLHKGIRMKPNFPDSYEVLAEVYLDAKEFDKAIDIVRKWREIDPDQTDAEEALAEIYLSQGNPEKAVAALRRALVIVPSDQGVHEGLAALYEELELYGQAIEHYRESMKWRDAEDTKGLQGIVQRIEELERR